MMKRLQGLIAGVLVGTMITGGAVFAATGTKTIEVLYNNIKVYKDNVLCELKDANGTVIEPFIYNGTTYMPVRGTANLAGMDVEWDGNTNSIYLWDEIVAPGTYLLDVCPPYETDGYSEYLPQSGKSFQMAGTKYSNGFTLRHQDGYALFNLNSKYSTIEFTIGHVDDTDMSEQEICFYVDGKLVKEISVDAEALPKRISIPVNYGLQLKILESVGTGRYSWNGAAVGFGNITVK